MPTAIRFHLDENIHGAVANGLRLRGIDVTTPAAAQLLGASDAAHLAFALAEDRVIVTQDDDFLRLAGQGVEHAGIAFVNPRRHGIGRIIHQLAHLWRTRSAEDMRGRIEFL